MMLEYRTQIHQGTIVLSTINCTEKEINATPICGFGVVLWVFLKGSSDSVRCPGNLG